MTLLQETNPESEHLEHLLRPSFRRQAPKASIMSISCDLPSEDGPAKRGHHEHQLRPSLRRRMSWGYSHVCDNLGSHESPVKC